MCVILVLDQQTNTRMNNLMQKLKDSFKKAPTLKDAFVQSLHSMGNAVHALHDELRPPTLERTMNAYKEAMERTSQTKDLTGYDDNSTSTKVEVEKALASVDRATRLLMRYHEDGNYTKPLLQNLDGLNQATQGMLKLHGLDSPRHNPNYTALYSGGKSTMNELRNAMSMTSFHYSETINREVLNFKEPTNYTTATLQVERLTKALAAHVDDQTYHNNYRDDASALLKIQTKVDSIASLSALGLHTADTSHNQETLQQLVSKFHTDLAKGLMLFQKPAVPEFSQASPQQSSMSLQM